jgi:hypothetical protein
MAIQLSTLNFLKSGRLHVSAILYFGLTASCDNDGVFRIFNVMKRILLTGFVSKLAKSGTFQKI